MAIVLRKPVRTRIHQSADTRQPDEGPRSSLARAPSSPAPPQRSAKRQRERKTERMDIRVTPTVREFVEHIMDVSGYTAGDLLLEGARTLLRDFEARVEVERPDYTRLRIRRPSRSAEQAPGAT